jgi:hypothetical protein
MHDVSVEGVNDNRDPGDLGGDPAERARLGGVGVNDLRLLLPEQSDQLKKGREISPGRAPAPAPVEGSADAFWAHGLNCPHPPSCPERGRIRGRKPSVEGWRGSLVRYWGDR